MLIQCGAWNSHLFAHTLPEFHVRRVGPLANVDLNCRQIDRRSQSIDPPRAELTAHCPDEQACDTSISAGKSKHKKGNKQPYSTAAFAGGNPLMMPAIV